MASKKALKGSLDEIDLANEESNEDPFATDFFSQPSSSLDEDETAEFEAEDSFDEDFVYVEKRPWSFELPQITIAEVNHKFAFTQLPDNLAATICQILASNISQIILQNDHIANCEVISTLETDFSEEIFKLKREQGVCLSFAVEPQQTEAVLILDAPFAIKLIETFLSSEVVAAEQRLLSKTELSVLEFLSLNCLKDINAFFSEPLFRWQTIEQTEINLDLKRGMLSNIRVQFGEIAGIAKLLLPFDFLQSLSRTTNPLLVRHQSGDVLTQIARAISGVYFHLLIGETTIDAAELAVLESGDVVLIENPKVQKVNGNLSGTTQIRVADETQESLYGDLSTLQTLQFQLREVSQRNVNEPVRAMMSDNQTENQSLDQIADQTTNLSSNPTSLEENNSGALMLEKVTVRIAVELVSRRISLTELANIHIGQVIELGGRATDPVELVADGKTVAIGQLIDVEGNLGVHLTRVLL